MVPRISLLAAPMTAAVKSCEKRKNARQSAQPGPPPRGQRRQQGTFTDSEQDYTNQSWKAIVDHLDGDSVLAAPDLEDPYANFVICTDASDFAVGGVLMQWQRPITSATAAEAPPPPPKGEDPLDSAWRKANGWQLRVISYYSKTLDGSQRNYPVFDKEAGAILLCVRAWSDLITYHPTTVYTDSSVAASMLTKHSASPRLQRWGMELGSYLPHLKVAFRKGTDNGLADLLSRFPAFKEFTATRESTISLPDDLFDKIGDAPLFDPSVAKHKGKGYLSGATYELYDLKPRSPIVDPPWNSPNAPAIPGTVKPTDDDTGSQMERQQEETADTYLTSIAEHPPLVSLDRMDKSLSELGDKLKRESTLARGPLDAFSATLATFETLHSRPLHVSVSGSDEATSTLTRTLSGVNCVVASAKDTNDLCDVMLSLDDDVQLHPPDSVALALARTDNGYLPIRDSSRHCPRGAYAPSTPLHAALDEKTHELLHNRFGMYPTETGATSMFSIDSDPTQNTAQRTFTWQERSQDEADPVPVVDETMEPTDSITLEHQMRDPALRILISALQDDPRIPKETRGRVRDKYVLHTDGLYRLVIKDGEPGHALVVPSFARPSVLSRYHFSLGDGAGHSGGATLYDQMKRDYYWTGMRDECDAFVAACEHCGCTRSQPTIGAPPGVSPTPSRPFEVVHVDHKTMPMCEKYTNVLAVVCALTKFTLYIPVKSTNGTDTLRAMIDHVFSIFGCPLVIISDNGTAFANKLMAASQELFGFRWIFVMPHTPQANGLAEAAVKKLKLIFDRQTKEYINWLPIVPLAQMTVNQRIARRMECPFTALFGVAPTTLAALENPQMLPQSSPPEQAVKEVGVTLAKLRERLRKEIVMQKEADASTAPPRRSRQVLPGDKVWLTYSDSERARYIRKHGHGRAFKHPFTVDQVKPHAVRLIVPKDGSVPEVLPWQSLRKCSFAAPHFHDDRMLTPDVNEQFLPMTPNTNIPSTTTGLTTEPGSVDDDDATQDNGWNSWTAEKEYKIERIINATRTGRGWTLQVKWEGYPDATPEPMWKILKQTNNPEVLRDIERCKTDYYAQHSSERHIDGKNETSDEPQSFSLLS